MLALWLSDDHGFSPLHWACREGKNGVVDMLIMRGARINVMNRGDDTPLHLAASHGHRDIVAKVNTALYTIHFIYSRRHFFSRAECLLSDIHTHLHTDQLRTTELPTFQLADDLLS